ncbi:SAM-dependent methyltransferase [Mycobacterium sp. AMU20-3851]|uniref:SAM-dependent methyltransferase n=1 Tax=Mycobacterium sp. AMU20-3851 TaxID=3122055 RepID=UPI0037550C47
MDSVLPGPALTAIGVAMIRSTESCRPDALYRDPWAQRFVDDARAFVSPTDWTQVSTLADRMYESRTIGVRLVDDVLLDAVAAGCVQVVLLGAGLDTHAFRLSWPRAVTVFEVDLPALFDFKERVMSGEDVQPQCQRRIVATDLRSIWAPQLRDAGFDANLPTCWIDHVGVSLPRNDALRIASRVTELSATGSRYSVPAVTTDAMKELIGTVAGAERLYRGDTLRQQQSGLGAPGIADLQRTGWTVEFHDVADIATRYGRPHAGGAGSVNVIAVR